MGATGRVAIKPWIVIAGGGTAGHVLPALAVAAALVEEGVPAAAIEFVGSKRGIEARLVPQAGFRVTLLSGRGIQRKLTTDNIGATAGLIGGTVRAFVHLVRHRPAVLLSVGGYAAVPCALSAVVLHIPLVLAESNGRAGAANRLVGRFAKACAVAFEGTGLPRAVLTGNPVRPEILALCGQDREAVRATARAALGVPDGMAFVAVFGGSLGAKRINDAVFALCRQWADRPIVVHHVVGERAMAEATAWKQTWEDERPGRRMDYRLVSYEDRMDLVYAAADVAVCRAGGTTVADLTIIGLTAILVPLPIAAEDHQTANARGLSDDGAAVLVPDNELDATRLGAELGALLAAPERRVAMEAAQRRHGCPDAAKSIVDLLRRFARRPMPDRGAT